MLKNDDGQPCCSLFDVDGESFLVDIRTRLLSECAELLPNSFNFCTSSGVCISQKQELKVKLNTVTSFTEGEHCITFKCCTDKGKHPKSNDDFTKAGDNKIYSSGKDNYSLLSSDKEVEEKKTKLYFSSGETSNEEVEEEKTELFSSGNTSDEELEEENTALHESATPSSMNPCMLGLRSPDSCSLKGVKIYSEMDIEEAVGMEKERLRFWNHTAKNLSRTLSKKSVIIDAIHKEWRLRKADLMLDESSGISQSAKVKKNTLQKNKARVERATAEVRRLSTQLKTIAHLPSRDSQQRRQFRDLTAKSNKASSELRKAEDALRKTIKKLKK